MIIIIGIMSNAADTPNGKYASIVAITGTSLYLRMIRETNCSMMTKSVKADKNVISFNPMTMISVFSSAPLRLINERMNINNKKPMKTSSIQP